MSNVNDIVIQDEAGKNLNGKTATEVLGLDNGKSSKNHQSIKHYEVDLDMYDDIFSYSPVMQESVEEGTKELGVYDKLNKDMFLSLYKYKPEIVKESSMHKSSIVNNRLMKEMVKTPEFKSLRNNCKMDIFNSALGTEIIGEQAIEVVKEWKEKLNEELANRGVANPFNNLDDLVNMENKLDDLMQQSENAQKMLDDMVQAGVNGSNPVAFGNMQGVSNQISSEIANLEQNMQMYNQQIDDIMDNHNDLMQDLAYKMSSAFSFADEIMSDVTDELSAWGMTGGAGSLIPYEDKKIALERIRGSKKLKDLTALIGRFKDTAIADQKRKSKDGATAVRSITIGNKIERVLPSEKMKMCNPVTKKDFYRRYNQKELMEYQLDSHTKKSKGPIICCIDTSGSMEGSREKWSKAIALAMLEIANIQKRDYAAIIFDTNIHPSIVIEKNEVNPQKILDIAEIFLDGGTNFEKPLEEALRLIKTSKFKKADIAFITDGDSSLSDSFINRFKATKEEKEFSVMSILINAGGRVSDKTLQKFSDKIITLDKISDLTTANSDIAHEIFSAV